MIFDKIIYDNVSVVSKPSLNFSQLHELNTYNELSKLSESAVRVIHNITEENEYTIESYYSYIKDIIVFLNTRESLVDNLFRVNYMEFRRIANAVIKAFSEVPKDSNISVGVFNVSKYANIPNFGYAEGIIMNKPDITKVNDNESKKVLVLDGKQRASIVRSDKPLPNVNALYGYLNRTVKYDKKNLQSYGYDEYTKYLTTLTLNVSDNDNVKQLYAHVKAYFKSFLNVTLADLNNIKKINTSTSDTLKELYKFTDYKFRILNALLSCVVDVCNHKNREIYNSIAFTMSNVNSSSLKVSESMNFDTLIENYRQFICSNNKTLNEIESLSEFTYDENVIQDTNIATNTAKGDLLKYLHDRTNSIKTRGLIDYVPKTNVVNVDTTSLEDFNKSIGDIDVVTAKLSTVDRLSIKDIMNGFANKFLDDVEKEKNNIINVLSNIEELFENNMYSEMYDIGLNESSIDVSKTNDMFKSLCEMIIYLESKVK